MGGASPGDVERRGEQGVSSQAHQAHATRLLGARAWLWSGTPGPGHGQCGSRGLYSGCWWPRLTRAGSSRGPGDNGDDQTWGGVGVFWVAWGPTVGEEERWGALPGPQEASSGSHLSSLGLLSWTSWRRWRQGGAKASHFISGARTLDPAVPGLGMATPVT